MLAAKAPHAVGLAVAGYTLGAETVARGQITPLNVEVAACDCPVQLTAELWDREGERLLWQQERTVEGPGWLEFDVTAPAGDLAVWPQLRLRGRQGDIPLFFTDQGGHAVTDFLPLTPVLLSDR